METYHKIQTLFKREQSGPNKGRMLFGEWTTPELEYLAGNRWEFTEKVDGTNIRIEITRVEDSLFVNIGGRTDNAQIPMPLLEHLEYTFPNSSPAFRAESGRDEIIGRWMIDNDLDRVLLFGEGYGPKIQGGGKYRDDHSFVLFDVKIGDYWLSRENVNDIASKLGIDSVPVIGYGTLWDAINWVKGGGWVDRGDGAKYHSHKPLKSTWGDFEAEGIVARPAVPMFDRKGHRIITKIKAVDFK